MIPWSRREQRGWYFYDWANSPFQSTAITLLLGPYLTELAKAAAGPSNRVHPLGVPVDPRAWWGYLISISVITQVLALPLLGTVADYSARKRTLLAVFAGIGAATTTCFFFIAGSSYLAGGILFLVANLAFGASVVVYNSFLPQIAPPEQRDAISSRGWAIGYLGGGILLALNLLLFARAKSLGISTGLAVRINLASAGVWWAVFTLIPLLALRSRPPGRVRKPGETVFSSVRELFATLREMRRYPWSLTFLIAYLLYNDAVQTVITLSAQFGSDELHITMSNLTIAILMVQFVAFGGSLIFEYVARLMGAKQAVMVSLVIWTGVLISMYAWVRTTGQFFFMAAVVAIVLGGTQALSRSLFSQMIPKGREANYFGVYEISDKGTSWMCPLIFALALQFTGSYRTAILSLIVFFAAGLLVLARVDVRQAAIQSGNVSEA